MVRYFKSISTGFITEKVEKAHKRCLEHVRNDCVSDPGLELALYVDVSATKLEDAYQTFRTYRGTSALEAFHKHARERTKTYNASPELYDHMLRNIIFRWNIDRAVQNGLQRHYHSYDYERLSRLYDFYHCNSDRFEESLDGKEEFVLNDFSPLKHTDAENEERFGASFSQQIVKESFNDKVDVDANDKRDVDEDTPSDYESDESGGDDDDVSSDDVSGLAGQVIAPLLDQSMENDDEATQGDEEPTYENSKVTKYS